MADTFPVGKFAHRDRTEIVTLGGNDVATLLNAEESAGRFAVREIVAKPGAASVPRVSADDNRYYFVVSGEWEFETGGERRVVSEGAAIFVPGGQELRSRLVGAERGKLLEIVAPVARGS